jgi:hypothetical protein
LVELLGENYVNVQNSWVFTEYLSSQGAMLIEGLMINLNELAKQSCELCGRVDEKLD